MKQIWILALFHTAIVPCHVQNHLNGFMNTFVPSSEADVGQEIFLPADPWELLKSGKIADVPLMTGLVLDEAGIFTPSKFNLLNS